MAKTIKESVLFRTSAGSDVQCSGGEITIAGLRAVSKKDITSIGQVWYKVEVPQVVTVGDSSYTPTSSTIYKVAVTDPLRKVSAYSESVKTYSYTTPVDVTTLGNAAAQREAIHVAIVAAINADSTNNATAATLGGGTGFTVTDDGGYYPVWSQNMTNVKGPNAVYTIPNNSGTGFADDDFAVTTAAVLSFGVGAKLLEEKPIISNVFGNLISGVLDAPPLTATGLDAVSGQNYNGFFINSLELVNGPTLGNHLVYTQRTQAIFVDNGTGSSTANLAGYQAFEREMHKLMADQYKDDADATVEFFDKPIVFQDPLGAAPTGTTSTIGWQLSPYSSMIRINVGAQTIVAPVLNATGLLIDQDDTATEGAYTSTGLNAVSEGSFIVGKTACSVTARVVMADYTDAAFMVGFRRKAAFDLVVNNYTDYATIGNGSSAAGTTYINGDLIVTRAAVNGGAVSQTVTAIAPVDTVSHLLRVNVAIDGSVTAFVNGTKVAVTSAASTPMVFDDGDEIIPFYQIVNIGSGDPACSISEFISVPTDSLIS